MGGWGSVEEEVKKSEEDNENESDLKVVKRREEEALSEVEDIVFGF